MSAPSSIDIASELGLAELAKRSDLLATAAEYVVFAANPPETNVASILNGPGSASMMATASAYASMAGALNAAAESSEGATTALSLAWPTGGPAVHKFNAHAGWLRAQAVVAAQAAGAAWNVAYAYQLAKASMLEIAGELVVNRALTVLETNMGASGAALALTEIHYAALWARAAATMMVYAGATSTALQTIPSPQPAPAITVSSGDDQALPPALANLAVLIRSVTSTHADLPANRAIPGSAPSPAPASLPDPAPQPAPSPSPGPGQDAVNPSSPDAGLPSDSQAVQGDTATSGTPTHADASGLGDGSTAPRGFLGTSTASPTLAGLTGGAGSFVMVSMTRGGLASMSGTSSGFRMPANWARKPGAVFGAADEPEPAPVVRQAPRGAIAPELSRRARARDQGRPSKVFAPGTPQEVSVLEDTPVVGVIGLGDTEQDEMYS